jgi:FemAB-related protein (PEP-CTERM system-associated)
MAIHTLNINDPADAQRIDAFVRMHPDGTPFHMTAWSRAIEKACDVKVHYLATENENHDLIGVLPLHVVRSALFGNALASSAFGVGGGALSFSQDVKDAMIAQAIALAQQNRCPTVELRGGALPERGWHLDNDTYLGFTRALAQDDDAELLAIPRKQRAEVRRALGFDLIVETGTRKRDRDAHYHVYATSVRNLGTPVFPRALFEAVLDNFGEAADILTVRHDDKPIASVLSLYHEGTVMPYWGGGTAEARTWRANDLMYYALMLHARKEKGCTVFDFGRSKAGTGPAAFKRNWGFEPTSLSYAKWAEAGAVPREINPLNPKYQLQIAVWKKLPLWVANRVGPVIARGLG